MTSQKLEHRAASYIAKAGQLQERARVGLANGTISKGQFAKMINRSATLVAWACQYRKQAA